ncbi:MAG TPA: gene transfer agent family protein [Allosphingosinicella sp.]|jgi:hypothetical protein
MLSTPRSRSAKIENVFVGEGYYDLCLRIGELIALQEKLGVGPFIAAQRLASGEWFVSDITETIRLALIGGGMAQKEAFDLVKRNIVEGHLIDYSATAAQCLYAALTGVEEEPLTGEAEAPTSTTNFTLFDGEVSSSSEGLPDSPPTK